MIYQAELYVFLPDSSIWQSFTKLGEEVSLPSSGFHERLRNDSLGDVLKKTDTLQKETGMILLMEDILHGMYNPL